VLHSLEFIETATLGAIRFQENKSTFWEAATGYSCPPAVMRLIAVQIINVCFTRLAIGQQVADGHGFKCVLQWQTEYVHI
jgi:hypothetical protein